MEQRIDIVVTVGPSTQHAKQMELSLKAGASIFRFPFAHDTFEDQVERTKRLRDVARRIGYSVSVLQDLPGKKTRLKTSLSISVKSGDTIMVTGQPVEQSQGVFPVNNLVFADAVNIGDHIYFADGEVEVVVTSKDRNTDLKCRVINDGIIEKGRTVTALNVPVFQESGLTEHDKNLIKFGANVGYDAIAVSFVNSPEEIIEAREVAQQYSGYSPKIIAKIETTSAIANLDEIIRVADGIMIARGDLALQINYTRLPFLQRFILRKAKLYGKYSIVATQMLESLKSSRIPNRAEILDIGNAVYQGASAVMLSNETTIGPNPIFCIEVMLRIVNQCQQDISENSFLAYI